MQPKQLDAIVSDLMKRVKALEADVEQLKAAAAPKDAAKSGK